MLTIGKCDREDTEGREKKDLKQALYQFNLYLFCTYMEFK